MGSMENYIIYQLIFFHMFEGKSFHILQQYPVLMEQEPQVETNDSKLIDHCRSKPELLSLNQIYPENGSQCNYCHKANGSFSYSFTKDKMEPYTYELMMERGWRRCGTYYYKPNLFKSCCKLFTHRLEAAKFHPRKDQRKALKKVISLAYERVETKPIKQTHKIIQQKVNKHKEKQQKPAKIAEEISELAKTLLQKICLQLTSYLRTTLFALLKNSGITEAGFSQFTFELGNKLKFFVSKPGQKWNYYSNFVMLLFGINKKLFAESKYGLLDFSKDIKSGIQEVGAIQGYQMEVERGGYLLFKISQNVKVEQMQVQVQQIKTISEKREETQDISASLHSKQIMGQFKPKRNPFQHPIEIQSRQQLPQVKHEQKHATKDQHMIGGLQFKGEINITSKRITFGKITIDIVPAEKKDESFKLYQKYTKQIHEKKEKDMSSYVSFLCLQSLNFRTEPSTLPEQQRQKYIPSWDPSQKYQPAKPIPGDATKPLGCYHMKYMFEGRLIAISVVDIVDYGFSSVYFFYDPAFKDYRLGVFSSIIEIQYIRWLQLSFPEFKYYYMGFYIANNQKMNYKNDYMPCSLLCPQTYRFVEFDQRVKQKTANIAQAKEKNVRLSAEGVKLIDDMQFGSNMGPIIDSGLKLTYDKRRIVLKQINPAYLVHILKIMKENLPVWGKKLFNILTFTL